MAGDIGDEHSRREKGYSIITGCFPREFHNAMMLMLGNHDIRTGVRPDKSLDPDLVNLYHDYSDKFGIHYYDNTMCIDTWFNDYHILCLNTDRGLKDSMFLNATSLAWLKKKLAEDSDIHKPIIVVAHQSFNSSHWRPGLLRVLASRMECLRNYSTIIRKSFC